MKKKLITILTICCMLFACLGVIGCGESGNGGNTDNTPAHVHEYSSEYSYNSESHWFECECGEDKGVSSHVFINDVCVCGYKKPHTHAYNTLKFDNNSHWYECDCGEKSNEEAHKGGTATCKEFATCEICNSKYGEYKDCSYSDDNKCIWCGESKSGSIIVDGNYVYFGRYPQTIKADSVTVSETVNSNGYYLGSDGEEYAKVVASPYGSGYTFSNSATVTSGSTYYFKVEPIRWRILDEEKGLIVCDSIIANKRYDDSSNNYKNSEIRAWLNEEFYNTAFSSLEQSFIKTTVVDNSVASTGYSENQYACEDTEDKVFLLSYVEAKAITGSASSTEEREMLTSDYSRATGVYMNTSSSYYGNGYWWLRSPYYDYSYGVRCVVSDGRINGSLDVRSTRIGVVPALQIQL